MAQALAQETVWFEKPRADDAERNYYENLGKTVAVDATNTTKPSAQKSPSVTTTSSIADEIARVRQHIKHSLQSVENVSISTNHSANNSNLESRVSQLEKENKDLKNVVNDLQSSLSKLEIRLSAVELKKPAVNGIPQQQSKPTPPPAQIKNNKDAKVEDDDDIDLFGSDDDDTEANELRDKRLSEYAAKKSKKPALIAKSSVVLDVKPWDDETDMGLVEKGVREITMEGLKWGASKLVPLAYGIKKLQIVTVVEDDKVSIDLLQEKIEAMEDLVQSVDIAAFNKL